MKKIFLLMLFFYSIFSVNAFSGTYQLSVIQDSYVNLGDPDANYDSDYNLVVSRSSAGELNRSAFIHFDTSLIYGIDPSRILSATLKLQKYDGSPNSGEVEIATAPWYADELTFNNMPATTSDLSAQWIATDDEGYNTTADVTSMVQSWASGSNPNLGVLMRNYGGEGYVASWFWSQQGLEYGGLPPVIEIEVDGQLDVSQKIYPLTCTKDSYVDNANPDTNYGDNTQLKIARKSDGTSDRTTFMEFELMNLVGIDPGLIDLVSLKMHRALFSGQDTSGPVGVVTGGSWQEDAITYNNAPAVDYNTGFQWVPGDGPGYNTVVDVNEIVFDWMNGTDPNYSLNLRLWGSPAYCFMIFDSKEETTRNLPPVIEVVLDAYGPYDVPWWVGSVDRQDKALYTDGIGNNWGFYESVGRNDEFMSWSSYTPMDAQLEGSTRFWKGVNAQAKANSEGRLARISGFYEPYTSGIYSDHYNGAIVIEPVAPGLVSWFGEVYCRVWSYDGPLNLEFVKFDTRDFPIHIHTEVIELSSPASPDTVDLSQVPELQNISVKQGERLAMVARTELFGAHVVAEFYTPVGITIQQGSCIEQGGIDGDLSGDCQVNDTDLEIFAQQWLDCGDGTNASCF